MQAKKYMPAVFQTTRYDLFANKSRRGFRADSKPLLDAVKKAKNEIRQAKFLDEIPPFTAIAVEYGKLLSSAILSSFLRGHDTSRQRRIRKNSIDLDDIIAFDWNLNNTAALAAFSRQAFIMAGVQTEELRTRLFEEAQKVFASGGTYLDWADTFKMHGFEPENPYHLRTNYDTAANAAYAAGQWSQIEEYKDYFPYLRYVTMQDEKVRDEHWVLDGLIYPVDDPFWDSYTPPNGWNCRCSVEQLMESELPKDYQPLESVSPVRIDKAFQNNPGKSQSIYSAALDAVQTNWKEAGLPPWTQYPAATAELINTDGMSYDELIELYRDVLADQYVIDVNKVPVALLAEKAKKFAEGYKLADLRGRFRYLNCIRDAIQRPLEAWLNPITERIHYIKKYDKNVIVIVQLAPNNIVEYFNIMIGSPNIPDKVRRGVLVFCQ